MIKLDSSLKKHVRASWTSNGLIYVLCNASKITFLTNYISKKYNIAREKVRVGTMEDLIKEITEHNTRVLISIRDGKLIYDPLHLISSLKINIARGAMIGTKEAILSKFLIIKDRINEVENIKKEVFDNIYTSAVEASQTALIIKGAAGFIPRKVPEMLNVYLKNKGLEKTHIANATEIIQLYKDYEHGKIKLPEGRKLDLLAKKSEILRGAVKNL